MTDAPERIWAWQWLLPYPSAQNGKTTWSSAAYPDEQDVGEYILSTPEALAASPEVQALIREAEALGMERIKAIERLAHGASIASCTCLTKTPDITFHAGDCRYVMLQYIIAQCEDFRAEAAAIRGEKP